MGNFFFFLLKFLFMLFKNKKPTVCPPPPPPHTHTHSFTFSGLCCFENPSIPSQITGLGLTDQPLGYHTCYMSLLWIFFYEVKSRTKYIPIVCLTFQHYKPASMMWLSQLLWMCWIIHGKKLSTDWALFVQKIGRMFIKLYQLLLVLKHK
jgi:hypothetical protein